MVTLGKAINTYHKEDFPNMIFLTQLAMTSAVHTAGSERGFSVQNKILTKKRNCLHINSQHQLMTVQLSKQLKVEQALKLWRDAKHRTIYEPK